MAVAKSGAQIVGTAGGSVTSSAGSTYSSPSTGCQSASQDLSATYEATIFGRMTPGASVTVGCTAQVDISTDGTNWRQFCTVASGLTNGSNYDFAVKLPDEVSRARVTFFGTAGGSVSCDAWLTAITAI
jgi:hypothetical protein